MAAVLKTVGLRNGSRGFESHRFLHITEESEMAIDPKKALDYPHLDNALYLLWRKNDYVWPDARRSVVYLTDFHKHMIHGHALYTADYRNAKVFTSPKQALKWLEQQEIKRGAEYGVRLTTVRELKKLCGYGD